jgi:hypothetical protein
MFVKVLNANNDFCKYISDDYLGQDCALSIRVEIEITFGEVLHNYVDVFSILKGFVDISEKWMLS